MTTTHRRRSAVAGMLIRCLSPYYAACGPYWGCGPYYGYWGPSFGFYGGYYGFGHGFGHRGFRR